jgi:integrase/recombinase XerD
MARDYLHDGEYRVSVELRRLKTEIREPNATYALGFKDYLELNNRKPRTVAKRLGELRYVLLLLKKDAKKATKDDIEAVVRAINKGRRRDTNQELATFTKRKLKMTLRSFYKWLFNTDSYPDMVKWIKPDPNQGNKLPKDMLNEADVKKLIDSCKNQRDKTIIALLWDTGMRVGELLNLKVKDVTLSDSLSHVIVSGKTGDRRVPLVFAVPYLAGYLNDFRKNAKQEDSLFIVIDRSTPTNRPMDYIHVRKLLSDLKARSNLEKKLHAHLFRHSRATYYANTLTEQQAKMFFGWSGGSTMVARYTHLSGRDIDNAVLKANGLVNDKGEKIQPKPSIKSCLKCQEKNEITAKFCTKCGTPLDIDQIQQNYELEELKKKYEILEGAVKLLVSRVDPETKEKMTNVLQNVDTD